MWPRTRPARPLLELRCPAARPWAQHSRFGAAPTGAGLRPVPGGPASCRLQRKWGSHAHKLWLGGAQDGGAPCPPCRRRPAAQLVSAVSKGGILSIGCRASWRRVRAEGLAQVAPRPRPSPQSVGSAVAACSWGPAGPFCAWLLGGTLPGCGGAAHGGFPGRVCRPLRPRLKPWSQAVVFWLRRAGTIGVRRGFRNALASVGGVTALWRGARGGAAGAATPRLCPCPGRRNVP